MTSVATPLSQSDLSFQSDIDLSAHYGTILSSLFPLFDRETDSADSNQACDNACGAVARLILKNVDAVPLEQVSLQLKSQIQLLIAVS